jgi:hypothetical protein
MTRRGAPARRPLSSQLLLPLAALLVALVPRAEASLTRTAALEPTSISASPWPGRPLALDESRTSEPRFNLFEGDELARAAAEPDSAESFHPLAAISLYSQDGADPRLESVDEASYPKTRVWAIDVLGSTLVSRSAGLSLESDWACGDFSCGLASGGRKDPLGLAASVSLSGVIVGIRPDGSRYRIEPGTDPVLALRILESDADITTAAEQEEILARARMATPHSSARRPGEAGIDSREPNYRRFRHYPSGGSWIEAALIATTGLPPQTREQEIASSVVGMVASAAPAIAGPIARAKGGVGQAIQPAELPQVQPIGDAEGMLPRGPFLVGGPAEPRSPLGNDVYESFPDPDPITYQNGLRPDTPVVDHWRARALRGDATDPANLHRKAWSENSRKGWHEGNYLRERERLIKGGLTPEQAEWVLEPYLRWIMTDIHATPVDPSKLDKLKSP